MSDTKLSINDLNSVKLLSKSGIECKIYVEAINLLILIN